MKVEQILNLAGTASYIPVQATSGGGLQFEVELSAGIYRISALFDAARFDWDRLWLPMTRFGNKGQITGPWDLDFDRIAPLVPAWWAYLNDERLGLACCPRPSVQMLQTRRLTLNWCFHVPQAGKVAVRMEPYNQADLDVLHFQIAPDRLQSFEPLVLNKPLHEASLACAQARQDILAQWCDKVRTTHPQYDPLLREAASEARKSWQNVEMLPMLAFAHRAYGDEDDMRLLCKSVEEAVTRLHWGNPHEDGFTHDGDMAVAGMIESLSFIYHWEASALEKAGLREKLLRKLELQMERFFTQMLLWDDYWGGSVLQDHGHRSSGRFGVAAINMLGVLAQAETWAAFVLRRMDRAVDALPEDGGIPFTSYFKPHLYMDDMTTWRDVLLHATGRDIFQRPLFQKIIDFVVNRLDERTMELMVVTSRGDRKNFYAGWGFFNAVAALHNDGRAARLTELLVQSYTRRIQAGPDASAPKGAPILPARPVATLLAALHHDRGIKPLPLAPEVWDFRPMLGQINYRPGSREADVALRCPGVLFTSVQFHSRMLADFGKDAQIEGHFSVSVKGKTLLLTAEGGYRQFAGLGSVLLVDGHGAYGDDKRYAMGYPGLVPRGEHVESARFDPDTQTAYASLRLDPAYPREAGLLLYRREFQFHPDHLLCRETVVAAADHDFSWNFHTYASRKVEEVAPGQYRITDGPSSLTLKGRSLERALTSEVGRTEVVWAYGNENNDEEFCRMTFRALRCRQLTAEFVVQW